VTNLPRWNEESDDGELVEAFRAGDVDAFECLVRRHQKAMLNVAYRMLGNYEEACEVAQDAFVAAYKGLANFRGEARFTTWLTTITLNQARNRLEHLASRRRLEAYSLDAPVPATRRSASRSALRRALRPGPDGGTGHPKRVEVHRIPAPDFREVPCSGICATIPTRRSAPCSRCGRAP
jgi:hypothetical protein